MLKIHRSFLSLFFLFAVYYSLFAELKITPVASVSLGGGQYFLEGNSSTGGNADIYICPVLNFSKDTALLPMYMGSYRGTKDVRELVGGGTLTQESQSHSLSFKFVTKLTETFKFRTRVGYKVEYLKETKDEKWTKGLFDYNRFIAGLEIEQMFDRTNVRLGLDYYTMSYPNYQSLVSKSEIEKGFETVLDTTTYKEISTNAGKNVLDTNNIAVAVSLQLATSKNSFLKLSNNTILKNFVDQKVVKDDGSFKSDLRNDLINTLGFSYNARFARMKLSLSDSILYYSSNQNSYDAGRTKYIPSYYNFIENSFSPSISFYLGEFEPFVTFTVFTEFANRFYTERLAQNSQGEYLSDKVTQATQTTGFSVRYPIYNGLSLKLSSSYRTTSSNMKYEGNYRYNYYVFNYFLGINWEL